MANCALSIASCGVTLLSISTGLCIVALFAPFWLNDRNLNPLQGLILSDYNRGLFLSCYNGYDGNRECAWNVFDKEPDYIKACMVMWAAGTAVLVLIAIGSFFICCQFCRSAKFAAFITFPVLFAALCLCVTVVVYGVKTGDKWDRDAHVHYDWGYYVAIGGSGVTLLAFLLFSCSICLLRQSA